MKIWKLSLNKSTRSDYLLLIIEEILPVLADAKVSIKVETKDGLQQTKLDEKSSKLTTKFDAITG